MTSLGRSVLILSLCQKRERQSQNQNLKASSIVALSNINICLFYVGILLIAHVHHHIGSVYIIRIRLLYIVYIYGKKTIDTESNTEDAARCTVGVSVICVLKLNNFFS